MNPDNENITPQQQPIKYLNPYIGGVLLGIVLFLAFFLMGSGLGASGALSRIQIAITDIIAKSHVDHVSYFASVAGGEKSALNSSAVIMLLGTFLGGMLSGILHKRFKIETRKGPRITPSTRWILAFAGGILMGYGARFARGCTSGQALSGGAVLSVGSWAFMFAVFAGGYIVAYFFRRLWV